MIWCVVEDKGRASGGQTVIYTTGYRSLADEYADRCRKYWPHLTYRVEWRTS
jgi:hypothetical protein